MLLGDIADINIHQAKQYIKVNANGKESILIAVIQQPNANVVELTKAMNAKLMICKNVDQRCCIKTLLRSGRLCK